MSSLESATALIIRGGVVSQSAPYRHLWATRWVVIRRCCVIVMLLCLAACVDTSQSAPPSTTTPPITVDWNDPDLDLEVGGGFRLRNCEGDAPLLCIERDGSTIGVIELTDHPGGDGQTLVQRVADHDDASLDVLS